MLPSMRFGGPIRFCSRNFRPVRFTVKIERPHIMIGAIYLGRAAGAVALGSLAPMQTTRAGKMLPTKGAQERR